MYKYLCLIIIMLLDFSTSIAQEKVLMAEIGNVWLNKGDKRRGVAGFMYYNTDTFYHRIDSFDYVLITNDNEVSRVSGTGTEEQGYIRYDSVAGIIYGRAINGKFGTFYIKDSSYAPMPDKEFIIMRTDIKVNDTVLMEYCALALETNYDSLNAFIVNSVKYLKSPFDEYQYRYLSKFAGVYDSIAVYSLWYFNKNKLGSGFRRIDFNFLTGFSTDPFGSIGHQGMHQQPEMVCFTHPTATSDTAINCDSVLIELLMSTNEITKLDISLYPNPAIDFLQISNNHQAQINNLPYTIYDYLGAKKREGIIENGTHKIDVATLNAGLYFIVFNKDGYESKMMKFIKM